MICKWVSSIDESIKCKRCSDSSGYCIFHKHNKTDEENKLFFEEIRNQKINDFRGFVFEEEFLAKKLINYRYRKLDFSEVIFMKKTIFTGYQFKKEVIFNSTEFKDEVCFNKSIFWSNCNFYNVYFSKINKEKKIFQEVKFRGQKLVIMNVKNLPRLDGIDFSGYSKFILRDIVYKEDYLHGKINFKIARIQAQRIGDIERIGYYYYNERNYGSKIMKIDDYPSKSDFFSAKFFDSISKYTIGYGEKPWNIVYITIFIISIFAFLYMFTGIQNINKDIVGISFSNFNDISFKEILSIYTDLWYFSMVTFTTVGYGDLIVATTIGKILVSIEVFFGVTIAATWASVVIKRMIR